MSTDQQIVVEPTAHPRARKFILERDVRTGTPVSFTDRGVAGHVPMAVALLDLPGVVEVHFAGNVITVTAARSADWQILEHIVRGCVADGLAAHDPSMPKADATSPAHLSSGDLAIIDGILEQTIRPYIRSHGGEVDLLHYDGETKRLLVSYQGTCGTCPASTSGTLEVIQQILREEFNPEITVEILG
jgi:Fe-S cluster biogenesis protein NfuA